MNGDLARRAGDALIWRAVQLAGVKGIFLVRTLILARLLSPDDFGLLAIATAAIGFLMSITELGMTSALVQQPELNEAHYNGAWTVGMTRALCVSAVLMVAAPAISAIFAEPRSELILRFLALKPLIDASASIKVAELTRHLKYRRLAFVSLPGVAVDTIVSVLLAAKLGVWALVAGTLSGALAGVVASYSLAPHHPRVSLDIRTVGPLIRYGRWVFLTGLVAVSASSLTQVVISRKLGAVELGLYFLAGKLAFLPHEIASQVVGEIAFSIYARIQADRIQVMRAFRSILVGMAAFLVPTYVLLISLAPSLVSDILGDRWRGTELLIQLLALVGVVGLFGDTTGPLFQGLGYPNWILGIEILQSSLILGLVWGLTGRYGVLGAALAWLIAIGSSQFLSFFFARRLLHRPFASSVLPLILILVASISGALTAVGLDQLIAGILGLLIAAPMAATVTIAALWFFDRRFKLGLLTDFTQTFPQLANLVGLAPVERSF